MYHYLMAGTDHTPLVEGPAEENAAAWHRRVAAAHELAGRLAVIHADLVTLTEELLSSNTWAGDGIRSIEHWLQVFVGLSPANAAAVARVAQRSTELPEVVEALGAGRLGLDQAAVVAQHAPEEYSASITEFAEKATVTQLRRTLSRYHHPDVETSSPEPHETARADASQLSMVTNSRTGRFELRLSAPAVDGALVETAIREAKDALFTSGNTEATLANGLFEMANRSLRAITSGSRKEHYRVHLHLDTTGAGWLTKKGALPQHLLAEFTCDGVLIPVWETDSLPVSVGRSQRIVPLRTRRLVEDRDRGCRYPGCPVTGFLENHHIQHWSNGGATNRETVVSLCPTHHRQHHQGRYTITGNPDIPGGLTFTNQYGQRIGGDPEASAKAAAISGIRGRNPRKPIPYKGPTGENLQTRSIRFTRNPPRRE